MRTVPVSPATLRRADAECADRIECTDVTSTITSSEIRLVSRPRGLPTLENFDRAQSELAPPRDGQVLLRNLYMSVDPYMRAHARGGLHAAVSTGPGIDRRRDRRGCAVAGQRSRTGRHRQLGVRLARVL